MQENWFRQKTKHAPPRKRGIIGTDASVDVEHIQGNQSSDGRERSGQTQNLVNRVRNGSQVVAIERHVHASQEVSKRIWKLPSPKAKNSSEFRV